MKKIIKIEDLDKIDMRTAKILNVEEIEGSRKLLKFTLLSGDHKITILSGIKPYYRDFSYLVGKYIVFIKNLAPRKIMGHKSEGMLLTVENSNEDVSLLFSPYEIGDGAEVL